MTAQEAHWLERIIAEAALDVLFQPIVDAGRPGIYGYEALVRGPKASPLHSPLRLFEVATKAGMQMLSHLSKIPVFLYLDFKFQNYSLLILFMGLAAIAGTALGIKLLQRIKETVFIRLYKIVLFAAASRLLYKYFENFF
jgi:hypothetical protein